MPGPVAAAVGAGRGDPAWANWPMGGVWLALHLWDHYAFGLDAAYLRDEAWPVLEATARFALSWITLEGDTASTGPATSPENHYLDDEGRRAGRGVVYDDGRRALPCARRRMPSRGRGARHPPLLAGRAVHPHASAARPWGLRSWRPHRMGPRAPGCRARASARIAPDRSLSARADHARRDARTGEGGGPIARAARAGVDGLGARLAGRALGAPRRRRRACTSWSAARCGRPSP